MTPSYLGMLGFEVIFFVAWFSAIVACVVQLIASIADGRRDEGPGVPFAFLLVVLGLGFFLLWSWPGIVSAFNGTCCR